MLPLSATKRALLIVTSDTMRIALRSCGMVRPGILKFLQAGFSSIYESFGLVAALNPTRLITSRWPLTFSGHCAREAPLEETAAAPSSRALGDPYPMRKINPGRAQAAKVAIPIPAAENSIEATTRGEARSAATTIAMPARTRAPVA